MNRLRGIWRTLGLAPTGDTAAIRKAYATALKTFDMDEEPARYIALREARDAAIALARQGDAGAADASVSATIDDESYALTEDARWSDDLFADDTQWQPEAIATEHASPGDDPAQAHVTAMNEHYDAVFVMLLTGDERQNQLLDRIAASVLVERVAAVLADPRLDELVFHEEAERWFAHVIASSPLRSDPILTQTIDYFGWLGTRGRIDQPPAVAAVVARYDALVFVTELQDRKHPLHKAWRELRKPADETSRKSFGVSGSKIRELLDHIRRRHPTLEPQLDWYRVALWEKTSWVPNNWRTWCVVVALVLMIFRILASGTNDAPASLAAPVPIAESHASVDIMLDPMLAGLGGAALTMTKIRTANPKLYAQLQANWTRAQESGTSLVVFENEMRKLLIERYAAGIRRAPHELLAELGRLQIDKAKILRAQGWQACDDFFTRGIEPKVWLTENIPGRRETLVARVLLETDGDPFAKAPGNTYRVSGDIVDKVTKRAGIPRADITQAMVGKGTAETRCKTAIALGETALTLPARQADTILRNI